MFHIGILMLLFAASLGGCVFAMLVKDHYDNKKSERNKQDTCDRIDRIAARHGLRVQYVQLKEKEDEKK